MSTVIQLQSYQPTDTAFSVFNNTYSGTLKRNVFLLSNLDYNQVKPVLACHVVKLLRTAPSSLFELSICLCLPHLSYPGVPDVLCVEELGAVKYRNFWSWKEKIGCER